MKANKSIIKESKFPCIGVSNRKETLGMLVLFDDFEKGLIIKCTNDRCRLGHRSTEWNMDSFDLYEGDITLSNKILGGD